MILGKYQDLKPDTAATINNDALTFACTRTPDRDRNGTLNYNEGTVQVLMNWGNYSVLVPRDRQLPENSAHAIDIELSGLESALSETNRRINGIALQESGTFTGATFGCGRENVAGTALTYMVGLRDGTSCSVPNVNYYRTLSLQIPKAPVIPGVQQSELVDQPDAYIAKTLKDLRDSLGSLNSRISGVSLAERGPFTSQPFGCGGTTERPAGQFNFMVGSKDGTSCGVPNVDYYKSLTLSVP